MINSLDMAIHRHGNLVVIESSIKLEYQESGYLNLKTNQS